MPIFQDDFGGGRSTPPLTFTTVSPSPTNRHGLSRKCSEESIRTDLCEGPLLDDSEEFPASSICQPQDLSHAMKGTSDRGELIERLKRGESPTWLPNSNLESLLRFSSQENPQKRSTPAFEASSLQPSPEIHESDQTSRDKNHFLAGQEITRPRSALHSGDFTQRPLQVSTDDFQGVEKKAGLFSDPQPWNATSPPRNFSPFLLDARFPSVDQLNRARTRAPSISSSLSSSFVLKAPTSPLVQSESNDDLEYVSSINAIDIASALQRNTRRHTLHGSQSVHSNFSTSGSSSFTRPLPHLRRDNTYPYQAHQPRRSLTSNPLPNASFSPQTPNFLRSRRPSYGSDLSPLHHAPMVGSYEESILRGRMSTTPSKPLDFVAQIGVLGLGKCKSNLRCPAHVTVPFPAVFYSYETTSHGRPGGSEDEPSPYVGQIDLESNLLNSDEARDVKRKRTVANVARKPLEAQNLEPSSPNQITENGARRVEKQKRRSSSPRAPPGGSYRIPQKGQLQIVIKNPNKTAVKLFLVPYDLAGMEPGTKTFIRQRSYSAGPIIDEPLPPTSSNRPTLRYLVHIHICSPSRGRFYLYKSIRLVFANRVPDGKEKLRNEISLPEPRFSVYKPSRDFNIGLTGLSGAGASLAAEKAFRRRSSGFALGSSHRAFDAMEGGAEVAQRPFGSGLAFHHGVSRDTTPVGAIPFSFRDAPHPAKHTEQDDSTLQSPASSQAPESDMSWNSTDGSLYGKLAKGDSGYGGNIFTGSPDGKQVVAESLLAKKLRDVGLAGQGGDGDVGNVL